MNYHQILEQWHPSYVGFNIIYMPPNWRDQGPIPYTFAFTDEELNPEEYSRFYSTAAELGLENPRLFTPSLLQLSSLLHPSFYAAATNPDPKTDSNLKGYLKSIDGLTVKWETSSNLKIATVKFWLQSLLFLTGVTLSAAIVQNRWSLGTLKSKLNRLWQAGMAAERAGLDEITSLYLQDFVRHMATKTTTNPIQMLVELKEMYAISLKSIIEEIPYIEEIMTAPQLTRAQKDRFGFVNNLFKLLGKEMQTVILYGSATKSKQFSDYDVILVVKNSRKALEQLAGRSPTYHGKELNLSVYTEEDFWTYQLASGDNLMDHGICLYGEAHVPRKFKADLMLRNYSFGFVRMRQIIGMAAYAAAVPNIAAGFEDKHNLFHYFIKIPLNVAKGIQGTVGNIDTNEQIQHWATNEIAYSLEEQYRQCDAGECASALANSALATLEVLKYYNEKLTIFETVPQKNAQLWNEMESGKNPGR